VPSYGKKGDSTQANATTQGSTNKGDKKAVGIFFKDVPVFCFSQTEPITDDNKETTNAENVTQGKTQSTYTKKSNKNTVQINATPNIVQEQFATERAKQQEAEHNQYLANLRKISNVNNAGLEFDF